MGTIGLARSKGAGSMAFHIQTPPSKSLSTRPFAWGPFLASSWCARMDCYLGGWCHVFGSALQAHVLSLDGGCGCYRPSRLLQHKLMCKLQMNGIILSLSKLPIVYKYCPRDPSVLISWVA